MTHKTHPVAIGIDTGGTNTDAAVVDVVNRRVLACAKAPTTYYDYSVGIGQALAALPQRLLRRAVRVGVSTTLATNAISTGQGESAGLILLGYPAMTEEQVPFEPRANVAGAMSITGEPLEPLDEAGVLAAARQMIERHRITALAISGFASIMNPAHEQRAAEIVQAATGLPVVQAHHLSMRLGAAERAVTAGWNARLLGNIARLLTAVEQTCRQMELDVPVVVIRADGTAMPAAAARLRPVETILSGPAASIEGGMALAGTKEAIVVDVGGTTTDIGLAVGGAAAVRDEVAIVGGYTLAVRAVQEYTVALGGDSYIQITGDGLQIGPRRVVPRQRAGPAGTGRHRATGEPHRRAARTACCTSRRTCSPWPAPGDRRRRQCDHAGAGGGAADAAAAGERRWGWCTRRWCRCTRSSRTGWCSRR